MIAEEDLFQKRFYGEKGEFPPEFEIRCSHGLQVRARAPAGAALPPAIQGGVRTQAPGDSRCAVAGAVPAVIKGICMLAFTPCHCQAMCSTVRLIFLAAASTRASADVRSRLVVSPEPVSIARVSPDCI